MTYRYQHLDWFHKGAEKAATKPVEWYGVSVYVDVDSDSAGADFIIDPADTEGIAIFRDFAAKMAAHYKTLLK